MSAQAGSPFAPALLGPTVVELRPVPRGDLPARDSEGQRQLTATEQRDQMRWKLRAAEARRQAALFEAESLMIDLESGDDCAVQLSHCYADAARELTTIERLQADLRAFAGNAPRDRTGD